MRFIQPKRYNNPFVVFSKKEISDLFKIHQWKLIEAELTAHGLSLKDVILNPEKVKEVLKRLNEKSGKDRDNHELFLSIFSYPGFYGEDTEIIYELGRFDPNRDAISSIDDLNKFRASTLTDFGFLSKSEMRLFQLKRYRGSLDVAEFSEFLKKKVSHYANDLKPMNLLILLQTDNGNNEIPENFFEDVHSAIKGFGWNFKEEILVNYRDAEWNLVIVQVHPELTESTIPFLLPSQQA